MGILVSRGLRHLLEFLEEFLCRFTPLFQEHELIFGVGFLIRVLERVVAKRVAGVICSPIDWVVEHDFVYKVRRESFWQSSLEVAQHEAHFGCFIGKLRSVFLEIDEDLSFESVPIFGIFKGVWCFDMFFLGWCCCRCAGRRRCGSSGSSHVR